MTWIACAACALVFVGIHTDRLPGEEALLRWGHAEAPEIYEGAYWSLISTAFVHLEIWHLLFNVYWLYHLGGRLEQALGWRRWLAFLIGAAVVSSSTELALSGSTGIGASGVVYAFFGFMWLTRKRVPEFAKILDQRTVTIFLVWLFGCIVLTVTKVFPVENGAHFAGLIFGSVVAGWFLNRIDRRLISAAVALMIAASLVTLFRAPWSFVWSSWKGQHAYRQKRYADAGRWYERSMQLGQNRTWCLHSIALARGCMEDQAAYQKALQALREVDEKAAQEVVKAFERR